MICLLTTTNNNINTITQLALTLLVVLVAFTPAIIEQLVNRAQIVIAPVRNVINNGIAALLTNTTVATVAAIIDAVQTIANRVLEPDSDAAAFKNNKNIKNIKILALPLSETYLQLILRARPRHWVFRSPQEIIFWTPRHLIPTSTIRATIITALSTIDALEKVANRALESYSNNNHKNIKILALPISETFLQLIPRAPRHLILRASREIIVWTPRYLIRTSFCATVIAAFLRTIIDAIQTINKRGLESDISAVLNKKKSEFLALPISETFLQLVPRAPRHMVLRASREIIVWTPRNLIRTSDPSMVLPRIIELAQEFVNTSTIGTVMSCALASLPTPVPQCWTQRFSLGAVMQLSPPTSFTTFFGGKEPEYYVSSLVSIIVDHHHHHHHQEDKQEEATATPIATTESTDSSIIVLSSSDMLANIAIAADKEKNNLDDDEDEVEHVDAAAAAVLSALSSFAEEDKVESSPSLFYKKEESESFADLKGKRKVVPFWMSKHSIARAAGKKVKGRRGQFKQYLRAQKKADRIKMEQQRRDAVKQQERMDGGHEDMEIDHEEDEVKMEIDYEESTTDACCSFTASNFTRRRGQFKERVVAQNKAGRRKIEQQRRDAKKQELLRQKRGMNEMKIEYENDVFDSSHLASFSEWYRAEFGCEPTSSLDIFDDPSFGHA
ncbi:unnamed protein product [Cylindrotheca closterium]|uniref:Uncharacterized protein n=1 Tax=Cylindrotheca closterium TaxID=2856 RepID=A0AAD2CUU7_9STRA|nr:unnamed protein product [Cylindrotheca closterium]